MPAPLDRLLHPVDISPFQRSSPSHQEDASVEAPPSSIAPYKRAPRACTQCRRDKTRCDNGRPCRGCVKRGRAHLCLDGCVACRRLRLRCDGQRPCCTCAEYGRECVEDEPNAIAAALAKQCQILQQKPLAMSTTSTVHSSAPDSAHESPSLVASTASTLTSLPRPHLNRSPETRINTACLACRRDNKNCPGGHPCPRCVQGDEKCLYVARVPRLVKQRCALCRKKNKKCDEARPCQHCVREHTECIDLPRKGTGPGLRVKRACSGCRTDKIQCEEERPCGGCKKKKIPCVERKCQTCFFHEGESCNSCARRSRFHLDQSPSEESDSDWEGVSTPSVNSTGSSTHPLDPRLDDRPSPPPLPSIRDPYLPPQMQKYTGCSPLHGPSIFAPSAPSGPFLRPYSLTFSGGNSLPHSESHRLLSISASLSDVRTRRPDHATDE